ncbi:hypothetical protein PDIDSM_185 [Penicillium digitatum]|nr:hypothetical protein PDIDSM_185 [Penicillium digitatum]
MSNRSNSLELCFSEAGSPLSSGPTTPGLEAIDPRIIEPFEFNKEDARQSCDQAAVQLNSLNLPPEEGEITKRLKSDKQLKQAEERRKQAEERRKQAEEREKQAEEIRNQEEERWKQEEERRKQAEERWKQAEERDRQTTFAELLRFCHSLLAPPLRVETLSRSTTGNIPLPTGKFCPTRLALWTDCSSRQQKIYSSVCNYLQPTEEAPARLFTPLNALEYYARRFGLRPISSEQDLENYEQIAVEDHVRDIIAELCKIDAARDEFGLGDGIRSTITPTFSIHKGSEANANQPSGIHNPRPDQSCIHRVNGNTDTLLTTVEYKPPHKLSVEALRVGLREMDLWKCMVRANKITTDHAEKLKYNAERLVCSAIVQQYHVMIQEGLEYSYVTNGVARILLRVPYDDPSTLYYFFCDPNSEQSLQEPNTSIARVLCLYLMAFHSPVRDQEWRNTVRSRLHLWTTSFDHARSQIPKEVLQQIAPHSDSTNSEYVSPESSSDYQPSSPPLESPTAGRLMPARSQASCAPSMCATGRSRQTRQAPTRIKRRDVNEASARSDLPLLRNERLVKSRLRKTKAAIPNAMMHNFAPNDAIRVADWRTLSDCWAYGRLLSTIAEKSDTGAGEKLQSVADDLTKAALKARISLGDAPEKLQEKDDE